MKPVDNLLDYLDKLSNEARALYDLLEKTHLQVDGYQHKFDTLMGISSRLKGEELQVLSKELKNIRTHLETTKLILARQRTRYNELIVLIKIIEEELNT